MSILAASLLSMAGLTVAVVGLVGFLGAIALRRCEHKDIPAVLAALGTLASALGRGSAAGGFRPPDPAQASYAGSGASGRAGKEAVDGTAPFNRAIEH